MSDALVEGTLGAEAALDRLGRIRLTDHSMRSVLGEVATLAKVSLPGRLDTSATLLTGDTPSTVVFTGQLARELDESQYSRGHGPCLHAARHGEPVEIADMRTEQRWPGFTDTAVRHGCLSSLSLPLSVHEGVSGALNIYARDPQTHDEAGLAWAQRFAAYVSVVVGNMLVYESALDRARNLESALDSRAVIDQAKGILMERYRFTPDRAFQALARASMEGNTKLRDVAQGIVDTGEFTLPQPR
jgi:transcriptional regulator with GAF, ATPase, and Fis domain